MQSGKNKIEFDDFGNDGKKKEFKLAFLATIE